MQHAGQRMEAEIRDDYVDSEISLARVLLTAGLPDRAAKLVKPWPQWVKGKDARRQSNIVNALIPVLIGLALDQDVQSAAGIIAIQIAGDAK